MDVKLRKKHDVLVFSGSCSMSCLYCRRHNKQQTPTPPTVVTLCNGIRRLYQYKPHKNRPSIRKERTTKQLPSHTTLDVNLRTVTYWYSYMNGLYNSVQSRVVSRHTKVNTVMKISKHQKTTKKWYSSTISDRCQYERVSKNVLRSVLSKRRGRMSSQCREAAWHHGGREHSRDGQNRLSISPRLQCIFLGNTNLSSTWK